MSRLTRARYEAHLAAPEPISEVLESCLGCVVLDVNCEVTSLRCRSCDSVNQKKFIGEMGIRSPGLKGLDKPTAWVFPELVVCLNCGKAEFVVPEAELRLLAKGDAAAAG